METTESGETARASPKPPRKNARTRPLVVSKNPVHVLRRANLKALLKGRFGGNVAACAQELKHSKAYLWQLVHGWRAIGETSARLIERGLKLQPGALDQRADEAFRRKDELVHQKGGGNTTPITMVPIITIKQAGGGQTARRKAMADASQFVPVPHGNKHMFAVPVEHTGMEPRLAVGDVAVVDPTRTKPVNDCVFMIRLKGKGNGGGVGKTIMRVACSQDSGSFTYIRPPEGKHQDKKIYAEAQVDQVIGTVMGSWHPLCPV